MVQSEQPKITNKEAIAELEDFKKYIINEKRKNIVQYAIDKLRNEDKALFEEFNKGHRMGLDAKLKSIDTTTLRLELSNRMEETRKNNMKKFATFVGFILLCGCFAVVISWDLMVTNFKTLFYGKG